jgi:hypothetical protein
MLSIQANSSIGDAAGPIREAIRVASRATGVPFDYLLRTAERESSLDPNAQARTSSAAGLFQFIDQTWLGTLKEAGAQHGYQREAEAIERRADGRFVVPDATSRQRIMDLRFDPTANAVMAAAFTQRNLEQLTQALGRQPTQGELYIAHFLGGAGASRFLNEAVRTPNASAATQFPEAARANRSIFFSRDGTARTFADVQERLMARHVQPPLLTSTVRSQEASATPERHASAPVFHSLFQAEGRGPVSSVVQALWGRAQSGTAALAAENRREPFFPSSVLRVGIARGNATELAESGRPAELNVQVPEASSVASPANPTAVTTAVALPLPPDRPVLPEVTRTGRSAGPMGRGATQPIDLLAFTRPQRS